MILPALPRLMCRIQTAWRAALPLAAVALLGGCDNPEKFAPPCPSLAFLRDAADLTRFVSTGRDITDMVLTARLTAVPASCQRDAEDPSKVIASLRVSATIMRGPAAKERTADLVYFVAVTENDKVLNERSFPLRVTFPPNSDRVNVTDDEVDLRLPVSRNKSAAAYRIYVGFRLTPDELAYNRRRDSH